MDAALDSMTLDQIRLFVCVAEEGSFSAAGRRLRRAQSAVSSGVANLEAGLDVKLFDRSGHRPVVTATGQSLLADAQRVLDAVGALGARAASVGRKLELQVSLVVDAICPSALLIESARAFQNEHPTVSLRIQTEVLQAVAGLVLDGSCQIGVSGPFGSDAPGLERRSLGQVRMVAVSAVEHPLAEQRGSISRAEASRHVQIVISQRVVSDAADQGVLSDATWRVADRSTKLDLIRAGLGWGNLPFDMVRDDLERGRLARLTFDEWGEGPMMLPIFAIVRREKPPGPAGQWLLRHLQTANGGQTDGGST